MEILKIILALFIWDLVKAIMSLAVDGTKKETPKKSFKERIEDEMNESK